ncbi:response regulator transcription factor [Klenkia taihuensis]|uniref:DNA-binding response regulator, NarL/FixJ family, contains REC and HTH domains n=1 Tax=Klenkia taihuensis TaxID=1225127 RepID=A0A1I1QBR1_9ACTN|nr:response regulator transcription factor [Klenkia taihuensis]GHE07965.1 transcriptional regulator [Klenkia taihuensis]SFD19457.1 DNA-binding response regulator, NarL/FixJ family, contains REC and HTH domains [Klenkia taihuensis]
MTGSVLVVDDHVLFAQSVSYALETGGAVVEVVTPSSAAAVLDACRSAAPATVLLDLHLGDDLDGLDLIEPIVSVGCRVLVLTGEQGDDVWGTALEQGASVVLPKDVDVDELARTVRRVQTGEDVVDPGRRHALLAAARHTRAGVAERLAVFEHLTPREAEVLRHLAAGLPAAAIASSAHVSEATVRTQIRAVLSKLGVQSQLQAVAAARRAGWLDRPEPGSARRVGRRLLGR